MSAMIRNFSTVAALVAALLGPDATSNEACYPRAKAVK